MSVTAVTGSASGIGAAVCQQLRDAGHTVIGIDRQQAEVVADLSTSEGRTEAVEQVIALSNGKLDGLVPKQVIPVIDKLAPNSTSHVFAQASHAPFISHQAEFLAILTAWLTEQVQ